MEKSRPDAAIAGNDGVQRRERGVPQMGRRRRAGHGTGEGVPVLQKH